MNKDKTNGNGNGKDKGKPWNKNKYIFNDGVGDVPKTKDPIFNLASAILSTKKQEVAKTNDSNKPKFTCSSKFKSHIIPFVDSYEEVLKMLLANKDHYIVKQFKTL